jgi:hypothetical protein
MILEHIGHELKVSRYYQAPQHPTPAYVAIECSCGEELLGIDNPKNGKSWVSNPPIPAERLGTPQLLDDEIDFDPNDEIDLDLLYERRRDLKMGV